MCKAIWNKEKYVCEDFGILEWRGEIVLDYQMQKTMGKCFRSKGNSITVLVRIFGSWYDYKVINLSPELGDMLDVIDFTSRELLVVINNKLEESDVNYIVNI